jgi:hypothetical protein
MHLRQRQRRTNEDKSPHLAAAQLEVFDTVGKPLPTSSEDGVDRRFIQVQVGHECDSSTAIYTHVSDDFMNTALRKALAPAFEDHGRRGDQQ